MSNSKEMAECATEANANRHLCEGFVDLQISGFRGVDFSSEQLTLLDIGRVTMELVSLGTMAFCACIPSAPIKVYRRSLPLWAQAMKESGFGKRILGLHIEGPFISPEPGFRGAHPEQYIQQPSIDLFRQFQEWAEGNIRVLTLDPAQPGAMDLIRYAADSGVVVSLGHHNADERTILEAVAAGAKCSTHIGNGIAGTIDRHRNPIWPQLACDDLRATFITDGHHVPPALIKTAHRAKGCERFIVISDATWLAGLPPGPYSYYDIPVRVQPEGKVVCEDSGYLAGSYSTMIDCMNFLASLELLDESDLWRAGCCNALKLLGAEPASLADLDGPTVKYQAGGFVID